jgi:hypothetical protein
MSGLLGSLRRLIFGETWTIPLGVATALAAAELMRTALPDTVWTSAGGFGLAAMVIAVLAWSLRAPG